MESVKSAKLQIEIKDVSGCGKLNPSFTLDTPSLHYSLSLKSQITTEPLDLSLIQNLTLSAIAGDKLIGSLKILLQSLFSDRAKFKTEKWLKVKTEEFQNFRVKVSASLVFESSPADRSNLSKTLKPVQSNLFDKSEKDLKKSKNLKKNEKNEKIEECPYLTHLLTDHRNSSEPLDEVWRCRNIVKKSNIQISFEPDNEDPELGAEIRDLSFEEIKAMGGDELKAFVRSLCKEVKDLEGIVPKLKEIKELFDSRAKVRRSVEEQGMDEVAKMRKGFEERVQGFRELKRKRDDAKSNLLEKTKELLSLEKQKDLAEQDLRTWQEQHLYTSKILKSNNLKSSLSSSKSSHSLSLSSFEQQTKSEINQVSHETSDLKSQINKISSEYESTKSENSILKSKINKLNQTLHSSDILYSSIKDAFPNLASFSLDVENHTKLIQSKIIESLPENESKKLDLEAKINEKKSEINEKNAKITELENLVREFQVKKLKSFEEEGSLNKDKVMMISGNDLAGLALDISKLKHLYIQTRANVLPDLDTGSVLLSCESQNILSQARKVEEMMDSADQQEEKLESLKGTMGQVKKQQVVHVPVKSDPVDVALAEYVNSKEIPVKFTRQENGNYLFGSSKVHIKLENSKLIVKIKGGTTSIKEFLDIYTQIEISKSDSPKSIKSRPSQRNSFVSGKSPSRSSSFVKN